MRTTDVRVARVTAVPLAQLIGILLIGSILRILLTPAGRLRTSPATSRPRSPMTSPARRLPLRFSTQTLLLQLGVVLLVVLLSGAVHAWLTYERLGREAENQALTLARTVASDPSVRAEVQPISRQPGTPPRAELLAGPLMAAAEGARTRTGA